MIFFYRAIIFFILTLVFSSFSVGQTGVDKLPLRPGCIEGQLSNGLKYIIEGNKLPAKKVEFRLVLKVGSVLEENTERGISHFLEHMVFNGTTKYPNDSIIKVLKNMGIKYGYDLNAFTDYDKTIYIVPIPTDDAQNIDIAIDIMKEWFTSLNLNKSNIEKEKKIVIQEINDFQQQDPFYQAKLDGSRFQDRFVLGTEADILAIDSTKVRHYYENWYRPDLATIIIVGDIVPEQIEQKIKNVFSTLQPKGSASIPIKYSLPIAGNTVFEQLSDTTLSDNKLEIIFPEKDIAIQNYSHLKNQMAGKLFGIILRNRMKADTLLKGYYSRSWYLSDVAHHVFELSGKSDRQIIDAVKRIASILSQMNKYGIVSDELENAKSQYLEWLPKKDFEKTSQSICDDYVNMSVASDRPVANVDLYNYADETISGITPDEVLSNLHSFFDSDIKKIICYTYNPTNENTNGLNRDMALKAWEEGLKANVEPFEYTEKKKTTDLKSYEKLTVNVLPKAYIVETKRYESLGLTEYLLSNGLRLSLRPTPNTESEDIMLSLISRGGYSLISPDRYPYYEGMGAYIDMSGVGHLSYEELNDICYSQNISVSTNIDNYYNELYGVAFDGNTEELLKLLYLKLTDLKKDQTGFDEDIEREISSLNKINVFEKIINKDPFRILQLKIANYSGNVHKYAGKILNKEEILSKNLDSIIDMYYRMYRNTDQTVVIVTGNFDEQSQKDMFVKYLGALNFSKQTRNSYDIGNSFPQGIVREDILDSEIDRNYANIIIHGKYNQSLKETIVFKMMRDIIDARILNALREKAGLVYSPYTQVFYRAYPHPEYYFQVSYSSDDKDSHYLEELFWMEMKRLQSEQIKNEELEGIKKGFLIAKREALNDGSASIWRDKLKEIYLENESVSEFADYDAILNNITTHDIQEAFRKYLDSDNYMVITIKKNSKK